MRSGKLIMMMGAPGCGKSTFVEAHIQHATDVHVSRDQIRFSMIAEEEPYFSKEKAVFKEFVRQIDENLKKRKNVWADATHLHFGSRMKLINALTIEPEEIDIIWINNTLATCIKQNKERKGTRAYTPEDAIRKMYSLIQIPDFNEGFDKIYIVEPDRPISEFVKGGINVYNL